MGEEKKLNDHDLLISINAKLTGLCSQFQEVKKENKEDHDKIWTGIEKIDNKKLGSRLFYWMMPFVILGLITVAGLASSNKYSLGKIEKAVELHLEDTGTLKKDSDHILNNLNLDGDNNIEHKITIQKK